MIETLVFFDIETTGLPQLERNRTKITELTFIAVSRRDIDTSNNLPLMNKLSLLFNPEKKIQVEASLITGLTNTDLQNQPIFKNRIQSINTFLTELPKPVCLIAHNGNRFDFKVLRAEYGDVGEDLPNDLLCLDSLSAFQRIIKDTNICYKDLNGSVNCSKKIKTSDTCVINATKSDVLDSELLTDDDDDDWPPLNTSVEDWKEIDKLSESFSKLSSDEDSMQKPKTKEKISCQLSALYKRFLNKEAIVSHRAEADCIMLLSCVAATKEYFLPWADKNCKLINNIKPLVRH